MRRRVRLCLVPVLDLSHDAPGNQRCASERNGRDRVVDAPASVPTTDRADDREGNVKQQPDGRHGKKGYLGWVAPGAGAQHECDGIRVAARHIRYGARADMLLEWLSFHIVCAERTRLSVCQPAAGWQYRSRRLLAASGSLPTFPFTVDLERTCPSPRPGTSRWQGSSSHGIRPAPTA